MFKHKRNTLVAWLLRACTVTRWPLMRCVNKENVAQHSYDTAVLAYRLAVIAKIRFEKDVNPERVCTLALLHDCVEAAGMTDVPTPLKYYDPVLTKKLKELEDEVAQSLVETESDEKMREYMRPFIQQSLAPEYEKKLVKAADDLSAYIYAQTKTLNGSKEFGQASAKLYQKVNDHYAKHQEVAYFVENELAPCLKSLDDLA